MAALTGITIVKRFPYRGDTSEEFSNTYHFKSLPPGDAASWNVLQTDVVLKELPVLASDTTVVRVYGYDSDDPAAHHVYAYDYETQGTPPAGTFTTPASGHKMAGDQAACVQWRLDYLSDKGKPVYLRKYIHGGFVANSDHDALDGSYGTALNLYAGPSGINSIHGGLTNGPNTEGETRRNGSAAAGDAIPYVTTRTLKRRGKRPKTGN